MPNPKDPQKGVILLIVLATILVVVLLSGAILSIVSNQAKLTQHGINRIKAIYAAKAAMNYTQVMLAKGGATGWTATSGVTKYACLGNCTTFGVSSPNYSIPNAGGDIPCNVLVTIHPLNTGSISGVTQLDIRTEYTAD